MINLYTYFNIYFGIQSILIFLYILTIALEVYLLTNDFTSEVSFKVNNYFLRL